MNWLICLSMTLSKPAISLSLRSWENSSGMIWSSVMVQKRLEVLRVNVRLRIQVPKFSSISFITLKLLSESSSYSIADHVTFVMFRELGLDYCSSACSWWYSLFPTQLFLVRRILSVIVMLWHRQRRPIICGKEDNRNPLTTVLLPVMGAASSLYLFIVGWHRILI